MLQPTFWSIPSLAAVILSLLTLLRVQRAEPIPGAGALSAFCGCVTLWALGQLVGTLTTDLDLKILASKAQYPGIAFLPVVWLAFALAYVRRITAMRPAMLALLLVVPTITVLLAWTNEYHRLVWQEIRLSTAPGFVGMTLRYGPWFKINVLYTYALVAAGYMILIYELSGSPHHRRALIGAIAAPAVVAAFNLLHLSGRGPLFIDLTPLGFALGAIVLSVTLLRKPSFELSPKLHREVLQGLTDPVVVQSRDGVIIEVNDAARNMLGIDRLDARDDDALERTCEAARACGEALINGRCYDVRCTELDADGSGARPMVALVFRDVTERLHAEAELRRMKQEMEHLAHTDALTELPNRRYFMLRLTEEAARLRSRDNTLSVLLVDLDHFKGVNDTYGHETGDRVLTDVARLIRSSIRGGDIAARLGGEEFAVLLPNTPPEQATHVGDRIRAAIEAHVVEGHPAGPFHVTVSAGAATAGPDECANILKLADQALYRAKASGRNVVCN